MTSLEQDHLGGTGTIPDSLPRPPSPGSREEREALSREIRTLSNGAVAEVRPDGPVLTRPAHDLKPLPSHYVRAFSRPYRILIVLLWLGWAACLVWFWVWWFEPSHRIGWLGLVINSALLLYMTYLPLHFLVPLLRMRRFRPAVEVPDLGTAFVVTRAPSEDWDIARTTLEAMLRQRFPHAYDVWLCDEKPTEEILDWCRRHGVGVSCRYGRADYHRAEWPRRTRCKEGNLAFFYDHWGYEHYDVVVQLDCDHVPEPDYLAEMVRPFADPSVGYVAAPSICDSNAGNSWAARGRLYREAVLHGPVQFGHSAGLAPLCIGSHYAVRTRALKEIGGLGPELAEDFSTTFLLNSAGWQGAFAIDAEAHGEGPHTFGAMITQEFQWSRSLAVMLFGMLPRHLGRMPLKLRIRFGAALMYYPLLAVATITGILLPAVAAITGAPWVKVNYLEFLGHMWSMSIWLILLTLLCRRRGLLRPRNAPVISWEMWLFGLSRWPFVAWGVLAALAQKLRPRQITFKVTPKKRSGLEPLPLRTVAPYLVITLFLSGSALVGQFTGPAVGYVFLCLLGAASYATVTLVVAVLHIKEAARATGVRAFRALRTAALPLTAGLLCLLPLASAAALFPAYFSGFYVW
ncbi:Glycosyltransferase, catalytic subunit of cellulose synthase and poly-beta-1,6-N-acetylglucosamine synthase [Streptomyces sp. DI166]|uniref:glycosyltransferase family 2 protein n=1 Tax=Streptomyces sp. DI166 TaxID=1839783 RepID=UPI0007F3CF99|nr:glycosyltransferase family 2 protein [Streptomyces sp. DI166]SBT89085.1 Glycosyltransferase, catalytic subunit of cellulose synthase and poly-beta-1,6-N-acetylglucosamine synthase [Streptomyces sp. DI166]